MVEKLSESTETSYHGEMVKITSIRTMYKYQSELTI